MNKGDLIKGFQRFHKKHYETGARLMEKLAKEGAHPDFFVINCIDPRNGADLVFDADPGQQFIHSQMAAIIPPYDANKTSELEASLSYAIDSKHIKHLIIMGHSNCGGCAALVDGTTDQYITAWVKTAEKAKDAATAKVGTKDHDALWHETERQVVVMSLQNILEYPFVKQAVKEGRLTVNGWFFDLEKATLNEYDPAAKTFRKLEVPANDDKQAAPKQSPSKKQRPPAP